MMLKFMAKLNVSNQAKRTENQRANKLAENKERYLFSL